MFVSGGLLSMMCCGATRVFGRGWTFSGEVMTTDACSLVWNAMG